MTDLLAGQKNGELQAEVKIEYTEKYFPIIRPARYGEYDNFDEEMQWLIPSLIKKAFSNKKLIVWEIIHQKRFCHAIDVARSMIFVVEQNINEPLNIGSGKVKSIKNSSINFEISSFKIEVEWDKNASFWR